MKSFEDVKKEMMRKQDGLGQKIDSGILDLVTVLNCLGFETISSCEGHPENGRTFFPEVTFMAKQKNGENVQDYWNRNLAMQKKLIILLQKFYFNRTTEYQHRLITSIILDAGTELRPHSGYLTKMLEDKKERNVLHEIYSREIQDFTIFLKKLL